MVPFIILFFLALFYGDHFLAKFGYQMYGRLLAEAFSGLILLVVVAQLAFHRRFDLAPKYVFWFLTFAFVILAGAIANKVPTGAVVMGIRESFKFAPLFLLPIVYRFNPEQMKVLLFALLGFAFLQFPFMSYQRITDTVLTGDGITGTLLSSNTVSIFLICVWAILFSSYLRGHVKLPLFVFLSFLVLFPTMLNETKGSLILLPVAFVLPLLFAPHVQRLGAKLMFSGVVFSLLAIAYSAVNSILLAGRGGQTMLGLLLNPDRLMAYLMPAAHGGKWMGRLDKLVLAWENLSDSAVRILLGVGIGNVNDTSHDVFAGVHNEYGKLVGTTLNYFLWEFGLLGVLLVLMLPVMFFFDARRVAKCESAQGVEGVVATGWTAISIIMLLGLGYILASDAQSIVYVGMFFSGYIAASAYRERTRMTTPAHWTVPSQQPIPAGAAVTR